MIKFQLKILIESGFAVKVFHSLMLNKRFVYITAFGSRSIIWQQILVTEKKITCSDALISLLYSLVHAVQMLFIIHHLI